jgi:NADH-quinone oxidoreductase subunit J
MSGILAWVIFLALSIVAIVMAASMILTMSMYRAGLALMASFVALAGLFILLDADLLAAIQIMMNVGGMLIMVLFMVMIMMDPGGEMMWDMKRKMHLPEPGAFSMHMPLGKAPEEPVLLERKEQGREKTVYTCPMHPEVREDHPGDCPKCGMHLVEADSSSSNQAHEHMDMSHTDSHDRAEASSHHETHESDMSQMQQDDGNMSMEMSDHDMSSDQEMNMSGHDMSGMDMSGMQEMSPRQNYDMMVGMAMSTAQLPWALVLGVVAALLLIALVVITPWSVSSAIPTQDAAREVGVLLLSRYMIGFEGAAFLIVAGIAGAVLLGKRERSPAQEPDAREGTGAAEKEVGDEKMYTCPMHSDVQEAQPGNCPICGMQLISIEEQSQTMHEPMQGDHT